MKTLMKSSFYLMLFVLLYSCDSTDPDPGEVPVDGVDPAEVAIQDYMWKGMNNYYLWQSNVPLLSDSRFETQTDLTNFLGGKPDISSFFYDDLVYDYGIQDRFSWVVDDYIALEESFQGTSLSNGLQFGLFIIDDSGQVYGVVRYVAPDSDASGKDIQRGEVFNRVNGTSLNVNNYQSLLFGQDNYTLGFVDFNGGAPIENSKELSLVKSEYTENPVLISKVLDIEGEKVGYLMYNAFISNFDEALNQAFAGLKADGAEHLVLDLRYNGGGSVRSASYLASMVTGQFAGEVFTEERWNSKLMDGYFNQLSEADRKASLETVFPEEIASNGQMIQSLGLEKVYVITTSSTASASELIINGLLPYIDVTVVGDQGVGKFVASVTLYDSDDFTRNGDNLASHTYAMQPIILEEVNALGENNGVEGFVPDVQLRENYGNMGVLGEISEPLLNAALSQIVSFAKGARVMQSRVETTPIGESTQGMKTYQNMYIELN